MTWAAQIRILFSALNRNIDNHSIRVFQSEHYGRVNSIPGEPSTCLCELYPLPRQRHTEWLYNGVSDLPQFQSLIAYKKHYAAQRTGQLEYLIHKHKPEFLVCFCWNDRSLFDKWLVRESEFRGSENHPGRARFGTIGSTQIVLTYHPNARFSDRNQFYTDVGTRLGQLTDKRKDARAA